MKLKIISQGNHNSQLLTLNSQQKKEMIQDYQIQEFLRQAHRVGDAGLTLCSSGNISWRIGDEALVSGTGSWVPTLPKEKVAVCRVADGEVLNGVKPSMESGFHLGVLRERPDCDVVLHFQSKYATVVSCMQETPKDFNVTAEVPCHVGREIPVIPYFRPGSPELAEAVKAALKDHNSALMLKHVLSQGHYNTLTPEEIDDLEAYVLGKVTK